MTYGPFANRWLANGYEQEVTRQVIGSCGVARSIIAGFHPADPGSNPGTSTWITFPNNL